MKKWILFCLVIALALPCALAEQVYDVAAAVEALKECWRTEAYSFAGEGSEGYLEIKNTRVVEICDELKLTGENAESHQEIANEIFADIDYIVEFLLYSDMVGTAPYTHNEGAWDCVVVHKDGTMTVPMGNPIDDFHSKSYSYDVAGIVENVVDLNQDFNGAFYLLKDEPAA